jgi:hypothetical protein
VLEALARDAAGLMSREAVRVTVEPVDPVDPVDPIDDSPPTVNIIAPASGSIIAGGLVVVRASVADDHGVTRLELIVDGVLVDTRSAPPYEFEHQLTDGQHEITVVAYDAAGNSGSASVSVDANASGPTPPAVDVEPPQVKITSPVVGATVSSAVVVQATIRDDSPVTNVLLRVDGVVVATLQQMTLCRFDVDLLPGTAVLTVEAADQAGNIGSDTLHVTVAGTQGSTAPDPVAPEPPASNGSRVINGGCAIGGPAIGGPAIGGFPSLVPPGLTLLFLTVVTLLRRSRRRRSAHGISSAEPQRQTTSGTCPARRAGCER